MKKSCHIAISLSVLLFTCFCCKNHQRDALFGWATNRTPLHLSLLDSIFLPADFPKHFDEIYKDNKFLVYSYYAVAKTGTVTGIKLSVLDMDNAKTTTISTGMDRVGQMRNINGLFVENGSVYTIDPNRQIINYDINLHLIKNIIIDCSELKLYPSGDYFIKKNGAYYTNVRSRSDKAEYNPLIKVDENGEARYINNDIRVKRIENQMQDYPDILADVYGNEIAIVPQHQREFFSVNMETGNFAKRLLPPFIPVDENPVLNQVEKKWGKVRGEYVKNSAFKWCSYKDGNVNLIFHDRSGGGRKTSKYSLYSLDMKNKVVSAIDSLPFKKPRFVDSPNPGELLVLENKVLYRYRIE